MDISKITEVNARWIFSAGSVQDKATREKLREIYAAAIREAAFYERMRRELSEIIDRAREKLQARHCPTVEEINTSGDIGKHIDLELKRRYYLEDANKISGIYDALSEATEKHWHYAQIARQARGALEG